MSAGVAEVHPLKQGLKQPIIEKFYDWYRVAEVHPLKQGLKPSYINIIRTQLVVAEVHPLKQGLKQAAASSTQSTSGLQRYIH